jgi:heat shock protein HslJ
LFLSIATWALIACSAVATDPLDGSSWLLQAYRKSTPLEGSTLTASFENGEISGSAGCNHYSGRYQVKGNKITISEVASTLMACPEPEGLMEQESMFLNYLSDAQTFTLADGRLMIFQSQGEALTFIPQE